MPTAPFKPQHLAKLVLGYLAEEQLMTAYDEFLLTSPYLDAFQNEFDRVFMTSLRSIVADYWAVKIYVESCQPVSLRRLLLQCSNTLDIIKCLIEMVDIKKIRQPEPRRKHSDRKSTKDPSLCNNCQCPQISGCECTKPPSHADSSGVVLSMVEATSLGDLPGVGGSTNNIKRHGKVLEGETNPSPSVSSSQTSEGLNRGQLELDMEQVSFYVENMAGLCNDGARSHAAETYGDSYRFSPATSAQVKSTSSLPVSAMSSQPCSRTPQAILSYSKATSKTNSATKVKILSDVPMQHHSSNLPPVLKNVSTPLVQMRTIMINGTPAYQAKQNRSHNFTKDEIMAMPTIILVPPTTSRQSSSEIEAIVKTSEARSLEPLTIDICSPENKRMQPPFTSIQVLTVANKNVSENAKYVNVTSIETKEGPATGLVKTVDVLKPSASLPKSAILESNDKITTPNVCPPVRKSSSTPRRNSTHVRVLDFATPRRILQETINELNEQDKPKSLSTITDNSVIESNQISNDVVKVVDPNFKKLKNSNAFNPSVRVSKNWDEDLRALLAGQKIPEPVEPRKAKKRSSTNISTNEGEKKETKKKKTPKNKKNKSKEIQNVEEIDLVIVENMQPPVKPTINVVTGVQCTSNNRSEKKDTKEKDIIEVTGDTPETDRNSLQNLIGAKLNLSDLLETPYKQALYDIQMETPKFFGTELGVTGTPISDIKIVNIPTPKFLETPKLLVSPVSYASRPTDYSSGGSYYKPEEHYIPVLEDSKPTIKERSNNIKKSQRPTKSNIKDKTKKKRKSHPIQEEELTKTEAKEKSESTRPVRKCRTKNLPNYKSPQNKAKNQDDTADSVSSYSGDLSFDDKDCNLNKKESNISKSEPSRKSSVVRSRKTPLKKDNSKSVIKVKPKLPSPKKSRTSQKFSKTPVKSLLKKNIPNSLSLLPVSAKSRRKSSTPRKLDCVDAFNKYECSSPETPKRKKVVDQLLGHESESEQLQLSWSDEVSQEPKNTENLTKSPAETEDINKIQEYIQSTNVKNDTNKIDKSLHIDLVKKGFDLETAKNIERDLLNTPPRSRSIVNNESPKAIATPVRNEAENVAESDTSAALQIREDDEDTEDIEFSVTECEETKDNYHIMEHEESYDVSKDPVKLKDMFTMEIQIDDDTPIKLIAGLCVTLFEIEPEELLSSSYNKELRAAVRSISVDKMEQDANLETPVKSTLRDQCYEIFDSTLTSIDTPMKSTVTKKEYETNITEVVLEVEEVVEKSITKTKLDKNSISKDKLDTKRKRHSGSSSEESVNEKKKTKTEAQYLLNSEKIQNMDIESVLSRLHGPENS